MKRYAQFAVLAGLVVGLASISASAVPQQQKSASQAAPAGQGSSQAKAAPPKKVNPKEEKAYKAFYKLQPSDPKAVVDSGKKFVGQYPDSVYAGSVYARMATAYESLGDVPEMLDAGHKALQLNPDDVDVLSMMAYAIPRRVDPNNLDSAQQLQEASDDATHALALLPTLKKPKEMTAEQFTSAINGEASSCHSGLGLVAYFHHDITEMVAQLEQAVKLNPTPDPSDQFLLGIGYMQAGRPADAESILGKCAAEPGPLADRCKSSLAQAKKLAAAPAKK
ncbi:MAG TPA: hypothetical protein VNJ52_09485 [Patescibacteria group bacterium]|nr:hypothetical protein [Patescibacteria group bacterium]